MWWTGAHHPTYYDMVSLEVGAPVFHSLIKSIYSSRYSLKCSSGAGQTLSGGEAIVKTSGWQRQVVGPQIAKSLALTPESVR